MTSVEPPTSWPDEPDVGEAEHGECAQMPPGLADEVVGWTAQSMIHDALTCEPPMSLPGVDAAPPAVSPEGALADFQARLKGKALERLGGHRTELRAARADYDDLSPDNPAWSKLERGVEAMRTLDAAEARDRAALGSRPYNGKYRYASPQEIAAWDRRSAAIESEYAQARAALVHEVPALAVLDVDDIDADTTKAELRTAIRGGFDQLEGQIDDVEARVKSGDIPLNKLGRLVEETKAEMGVSAAARADGDVTSEAVLGWLEDEQFEENLITWGGTGATVVLGVGAFFASGGTALLLGALGAGVGLGTAAYEYEMADDVYDTSQASLYSDEALTDPDEARFNYIMAAVNLVAAGADVGLALKAGSAVYKSARLTGRYANTANEAMLKGLRAEQITGFERAAALSGDAADEAYATLRRGMDPEEFARAKTFFEDRAASMKALDGIDPGAADALHKELGREGVERLTTGLDATEALALRQRLGEDAVQTLVAGKGIDGATLARLEADLGADGVRMLSTNLQAVDAARLAGMSADELGRLARAPDLHGLLSDVDGAVLAKLDTSLGHLTANPDARARAVDMMQAMADDPRIEGLQDWITFSTKAQPPFNDVRAVQRNFTDDVNELMVARNIVDEPGVVSVNIGGDARKVTVPGTSRELTSFDVVTETGALRRNVEVKTLQNPLTRASDLSEGLAHAADKVIDARSGANPADFTQGAVEGAIVVRMPPPKGIKNGQITTGLDGTVTMTTNGQVRSQSNLFEQFTRMLNGDFRKGTSGSRFTPPRAAAEVDALTVYHTDGTPLYRFSKDTSGAWSGQSLLGSQP